MKASNSAAQVSCAQFRPADELVGEETVYHYHQDAVDPQRDLDLPWVGETFRVGKQRYSVVILNHSSNPPGTRFSAYRDYGRFGAYPVLSIPWGESATLRYRWLVAGGLCYTGGVAFYLWKSRPYTHAIWHVFVFAGVACHFVTVLSVTSG